MSNLIAGDDLQVCIEGCIIPSRRKLLFGEIGQTFTVELVLEMLEGESIVENIS